MIDARLVLSAMTLALGMVATDARAWLKFCNRTAQPVNVAIAVGEKEPAGTGARPGVTVEGWWRVAAGRCSSVSGVDAAGSSIYYHAHTGTRTWAGPSRLCVRSRHFNRGQQFLDKAISCAGEWRAIGFRRTDPSGRNHTVNLT
jgi:uncharacterized membrane protein